MRTLAGLHHLPLVAGILGLGCFALQAQAQDAGKEQKLLRIIEAQQRQLEDQQIQLDTQSRLLQQIQAQTKSLVENSGKEVERLSDLVKQQQKELDSLEQQVTQSQIPAEEAVSLAEGTETTEQAPVKKPVTSAGGERVKLAISGQVNRMMSIIDDGEDTDAYFVDNDNSETQVRFVGTAKPNEDLTLGGTIELSIAPNKSGNVDQLNQEINNIFDQRKAEVTLESKRWGKLWLGKGDTASYGAGAVDLSKTSVISYATIVDTAGSFLFRESNSGALTNLRIFEAFNSFDGLNRRDRLRYDSPRLGGFLFATSAVSNQRYDAALRWGGRGYGFKAAGGTAISEPNVDDANLQYNGSFSLLHESTGLNATLSFGLLDRTDQSDQQNHFAKVGWLKRFFSVGDTAFSVDYTRSLNLPTDSDDGYSVAVAAAQQFDEYGTELYALYRLHSLDRDVEPSVDNISVFSIGTRVKF